MDSAYVEAVLLEQIWNWWEDEIEANSALGVGNKRDNSKETDKRKKKQEINEVNEGG